MIHVSPDGDDRWSGVLAEPDAAGSDGPFATLERAREVIRERKASDQWPGEGALVLVAGGTYVRRASFELDERDSGEPGAPIVYRAADGATPRFLGGALVEDFEPLTDEAVLARLDPTARDAVLVTDLRAAGVEGYGTLLHQGFGRGGATGALELYLDGKKMPLARWPNEGWTRIAAVPRGKDGGAFTYGDDRPERWSEDAEVWIHGYWTWDWADSFERVARIDREAKELFTGAPHGVYGYKQGARYYYLNVLEELDAPGEWFLDRERGRLYFWPPAPLGGTEVLVSMLDAPFVVTRDASYVTFEGLSFEGGRSGGLDVRGGREVRCANCRFTCLGTTAARLEGTAHAIVGCELAELGRNGIALVGGDRMTLERGDNLAANNRIHDFGLTVRTYVPAISLAGVGNLARNNDIHDAPHMAIGLSGNLHEVHRNEVYRVCLETHDCGAFYMGRDWSARGNAITENWFHHLGGGDVQAIYLDDWTSGTLVRGNVVEGARRGVLVGGGRDNVILNNVFVECGCAVHVDERGKGWASYYFDGSNTTLFDRLEAVNATGPVYTERWPELATLLEDDPKSAKGNVIRQNIRFRGGWLQLRDGLTVETPYLTIEDNWTEGDPGFVDATARDWRLREDAPVLELGFRPIPIEQIGARDVD